MNRKVKYSIWGIILLFVVAAILLTSKNVLVHANICLLYTSDAADE